MTPLSPPPPGPVPTEGGRWPAGARALRARIAAQLSARLLPAGAVGGRLASGVAWSLGGAVVSRALNLAASVACARLMGRAAFGEFGMVMGTVNALGAFSTLGLGVTATRWVAELRDRDPARVARVLRLSSRAALLSGALVAGALALLAPVLAARLLDAPRLGGPLVLGAALVLLNAVVSFQNGALAGFEAFPAIARIGFASGAAALPLIAVGAWRGGVEGAVLGTALALLANAALNVRALSVLRRGLAEPPAGTSSAGEARILWGFGLPSFLATLAVAPALWSCTALLARQPGGYEALALYAAADRWRLALLFVPTTVFRAVLPLLSNLRGVADQTGYHKVNRANLVLTLLLVAAPAAALALLAAPVMTGFGPGFRVGWPVLAVLAVGTVPEALNTVFGYPLVVGDRMWTRLGFDVVLAVALAGLGLVLVPRLGALGLAFAYVGAFTGTSLGLYLLTWRAPLPGPSGLGNPAPAVAAAAGADGRQGVESTRSSAYP
jgi:O-antigen/teichoic acid export membrane protein